MLESCSYFYSKDGAVVPITPKFKDNVKGIVSQLASKSLRTLIIAYKHFPEDHPAIKRQINALKTSKSSRR
jgi:magnesium-transporting ATPase (P-type)